MDKITETPEVSRNTELLGAFVRAHRERLTPAQAGLTVHGRRRTQGLRREELAQLCAISTTWVTWIEQGRSIQPSASVLDRLAEALQLSAAERAYLFHLAASADPTRPRTGSTVALPPAIKKLVRTQHHPAYVLDRYWNLPVWNEAASFLFHGWLDRAADTDETRPNLLRFLFLSEIARTLIIDWETRARRLTAEFRSDVGKYLEDPGLHHLISALSAASEEFRQLWISHDVLEREGGTRVFLHATLGQVAFEQLTLVPSIGMDFKLVVLLPSD